jgi:formate dehydrogenase subunit gamma
VDDTAATTGAPSAEADVAAAIIDEHVDRRGPLLPILHALQEAFGSLDRPTLDLVADRLNLSQAEVHGVVSFYRDFRREPAGRCVVRVCRAEACQSLGADALLAHAVDHLATPVGTTTADGAVSLEPVFCLGNCALSPSVMIDGQVHGRVSPARFDELVAHARSH